LDSDADVSVGASDDADVGDEANLGDDANVAADEDNRESMFDTLSTTETDI
jgi:hypothetical protein